MSHALVSATVSEAVVVAEEDVVGSPSATQTASALVVGRRPHEARWRRAVGVAGGLVVATGAVTGAVAVAGRRPADPVLGLAALGAVTATPGVIALLGLHGRPMLWSAAGFTALPLAFLSFAGLSERR